MNERKQQIPLWTWRASRMLLAGAVLVTLGLLAATLAGAADPHPLGAMRVDDRFAASDKWRLSADSDVHSEHSTGDGGQYQVTVRAGTEQITGISPELIDLPCTIELSAAQVSGSGDSGYGLWWGDASRNVVVLVGVNSDGYLAILPGDAQSGAPTRAWELFPHVNPLGQTNVLRVDIAEDQFVIRLNDEVAGQIAATMPQRVSSGFFVQASPHGDATFRFLSFRVWAESAPRR